MSNKKNKIDLAIDRKFIKPLDFGCKYNIGIIKDSDANHYQTVSLLRQSYNTLEEAFKLINSGSLVSSNVLIRSALEYLMMAVSIQFNESIFNEFINLNSKREESEPLDIINEFKKDFLEMKTPLFEDINHARSFTNMHDFYTCLCNFSHASVVVCTFDKINDSNEITVLKQIFISNYYYLKMLLFYVLIYFTKDKNHYLLPQNIGCTFLLYSFNIFLTFKNNNLDFDKYKDFLMYSINEEYFNNLDCGLKRTTKEVNSFNNMTEDEIKKFNELLKEFIS